MRRWITAFSVLGTLSIACGTVSDDLEVTEDVTHGVTSAEAAGILAVVNDPTVGFDTLDDAVRLDRRAARRIVEHRNGQDGVAGTGDDDLFDSLAELDAIRYVGKTAIRRILDYARANGYMDDEDPVSPADRARAILALVNDPAVDYAELDDDVGLDRRAASGIVTQRDGADGVAGTSDDELFATLAQLDAVRYVGRRALDLLFEYAAANGYLLVDPDGSFDVIFSPQPYSSSHNVRVARIIGTALHSLDIAMYSFSDAGISRALEAALQRGVKVRMVFETANQDRKVDASGRWNTKSGRLEAMGVNVRYVNKIMHHKWMIVDGPRDDASRAATATVISGSGNWSNGAATRYDENTLFLTGYAELTLRLQREFNRMWAHSRDFVHDDTLPYELSTFEITDADITDDAATHVYLTSYNFRPAGQTWRIVTGNNTVSDALVAAIEGATDSIHVASGHLRSRPVAEALMARAAANPQMDIRVYLDGQEYVSAWAHNKQIDDLEECLVRAGTSASKIRKCHDRGFRYGYRLAQSGLQVRYKYYSYRWHYSYAKQMHHKLMIIDGDELWTGSYNLSDNAEHNTFENMIMLKGAEFTSLVAEYEANFDQLWNTSRDDSTLDNLLGEVRSSHSIPLVFAPMALDWDQVTTLKAEIRAHCADINTEPYRTEPENHYYCPRN